MNRSQAMLIKADRLRANAPKTNHLLHLFLTLITGGGWLIIWLLCGAVTMHQAHYNSVEADRLEEEAISVAMRSEEAAQ